MMFLLYFLVFGLVVTIVMGLVTSWIDRKVTARVQYRVGPPFLQPLIDIVKLLGKETVIPAGAAREMFLFAPLLGFAGVVSASTVLWANQLHAAGFMGDLIVAVYLLTIPSLSIILGGFASGNPLASLGASREMKLVVAYELPFILAILVPVIWAGSFGLGDIIESQKSFMTAGHISGMIALAVAILCIQAKLAMVPFDIPEAETEIVEGPLVEYSGPALGIFKLTRSMLLFTLPFFLLVLFFGGLRFSGPGFFRTLLEYVGIVAILTVIRNTNPRVRIDQAVRFFWGPVTILAVIAVVLALNGI